MNVSDCRIQPPPRSSRAGTIVIGITVVLLSILPFSPRIIGPWAAALAAMLVIAAALAREIHALCLVFFTAALTTAPFLHSSFHAWPFHLLIPILSSLVILLSIPRFRTSLRWLRIGRFGKDICIMVTATVAISGIALYIWYRALNPDLSTHLKYMPDIPVWLFPLAGLGFSVFNAAMEEFVFRGVVMQALDSAFGPDSRPIAIQAWLFGAMHYREGFPNGAGGLAMAFVYGIMLGVIRRRSQGMLAPWIAHVCADIVIFAILAGIVLGQ
jgi:membrane protease YdiL (CAAX protease family)